MRCTDPRTVGFTADGKITFSPKERTKELATFQLPCGQCLECRLDYARQWAVRCVHEAKMHEQNAFITLTYSDEHLKSPKLIYEDFQKFMKRLRKRQNSPIGVFVTGEYGEKNKRPHWHALIFGWSPSDGVPSHSNDRGDTLYESEILTRLWGKGKCDYGAVTFESAGYCARYAAKKLVHGKDSQHGYHPISKKSSKHAIGKKWLEKYYKDVFNHGKLLLMGADGHVSESSIPRYYERWFKENHPDEWLTYVQTVKLKKMEAGRLLSEKEISEYAALINSRALSMGADSMLERPLTQNETKKKLTEQKFQQLQVYLKL